MTEIKLYKSFDDMGLKNSLLRGIYSYGFELPSNVQQKGIVPAMSGKDLIIQAQSGTGKTGTFSIAALQRIDEKNLNCQIIVLSPTRELALQTEKVMLNLGKFLDIKICSFIGGRNIRNDYEKLKNGVHVVIGTPGRVLHLIGNGAINLDHLKMFILDEADEMLLSYGFKESIYNIFKTFNEEVCKNLQVALYSATLQKEVFEVTQKFMIDPLEILVNKKNLTLKGIKQFYVKLEQERHKYETICDIYAMITISQSIIYCSTRGKVEWLAERMNEDGHAVSIIHGQMDQENRQEIMNHFISGETRVLISTDLLSRGIDVHHVSMVINYDLPGTKESYIHRIGRSGRYGRKGVAINFVLYKDMNLLHELEKHYETEIEEMPNDISQFI